MQATHFQRALKLSAAAAMLAAGGALHAQNAAAKAAATGRCAPAGRPGTGPPTQGGVIRRSFDIISTDVIVRDNKGQFIADLKKEDFEVFEDGVKQERGLVPAHPRRPRLQRCRRPLRRRRWKASSCRRASRPTTRRGGSG